MASAVAPPTATPTYHDALSIDINTLSLLLQRNHQQHRRCIYFRCMSMVLSALRRLPSIEEMDGWIEEWSGLVQLLLDRCDESKDASRKRSRKEDHWTLERDDSHGGDAMKIVTHDADESNNLQEFHQMPTILQQLKILTTQSLPNIISRIIHATPPILHEMSRGYFVPFLTVALACLGRIHTLCLRMGKRLVAVLREPVPLLRNKIYEIKKIMIRDKAIADWKVLEEIATSTFIVDAKNDLNPSRSGGTTPQEWNDLMEQFVESSQDDLTKQVNEFVRERRWEDAMSKFGFDKSVARSSTSNVSGEQVGNDQGDIHTLEHERSSLNGNTEKLQTATENEPNAEMYHDTGELVGMHTSGDTTTQSKVCSDTVDDNMARILQKEKDKRQDSSKPSAGAPVSRKKGRKKKRGKKSGDDSKSRTNGAEPIENQSNNAETTSINCARSQEEEVACEEKETVPPSGGKCAESAVMQVDSAGAVDSVASEKKDADAVKPIKTKKKSSKKSKKKQKRKSSNVIDDIFGF